MTASLSKIRDLPLLMISWILAIGFFTVHFSNGFAAGSNGFEIPLYYFLMLFLLLIYGPGKISVDYAISRSRSRIQVSTAEVSGT